MTRKESITYRKWDGGLSDQFGQTEKTTQCHISEIVGQVKYVFEMFRKSQEYDVNQVFSLKKGEL